MSKGYEVAIKDMRNTYVYLERMRDTGFLWTDN